MMQNTINMLLKQLNTRALSKAGVIPWSCPVPAFGDFTESKVATLGLNPSNREFVDMNGIELDGNARRFQTLQSLGLDRWSDATALHIRLIEESCRKYFANNPYDGWFRGLDHIISGASASYYNGPERACHLDLIPFATASKWTELTSQQRALLLELSGDSLGYLLQDSPIQVLVLNGRTVIDTLQKVSNTTFRQELIPEWTLPRRSGSGVLGYAYTGTVRKLAGIKLHREVYVLGFNHNIQSSFGVTNKVKAAIRDWVAKKADEVLS